jgi:hypothetical protein
MLGGEWRSDELGYPHPIIQVNTHIEHRQQGEHSQKHVP